MERLNEITVLALLLINIVAFAAYGIDKRKAKKGKWRIHQALSQAILVQKRKKRRISPYYPAANATC